MTKLEVCPARRLKPGGCVCVKSGPHEVVVFNVAGRFHAVQNRCPHAGAPLEMSGSIRGNEIVCDWHGLGFHLETGASDGGYELRVYPTGVDEHGVLYVELP